MVVCNRYVFITESAGVAIAPPRQVRRGSLVFSDEFDGAFDPSKWDYEVSMYGGYVSLCH